MKHHKINERDIAHNPYIRGDRLNVVHTLFGTLGIFVCVDAFASDNALAYALGYRGADIILTPCA